MLRFSHLTRIMVRRRVSVASPLSVCISISPEAAAVDLLGGGTEGSDASIAGAEAWRRRVKAACIAQLFLITRAPCFHPFEPFTPLTSGAKRSMWRG